jgi:hypothetical protein
VEDGYNPPIFTQFRNDDGTSTVAISSIVFPCVFGEALVVVSLHAILPQHDLTSDSRDVIKPGAVLARTMAALDPDLLVASAKDSCSGQITSSSRRYARHCKHSAISTNATYLSPNPRK